jgi:hypothetical protein
MEALVTSVVIEQPLKSDVRAAFQTDARPFPAPEPRPIPLGVNSWRLEFQARLKGDHAGRTVAA